MDFDDSPEEAAIVSDGAARSDDAAITRKEPSDVCAREEEGATDDAASKAGPL